MRALASFACLATLAAVTPAAAGPDKCNLSTDAGIDAAYKAATGNEIGSYGGRCVTHSTTFPSMIAIGEFASDYGCHWLGYLHGCKWNDPAAARVEMAAAGWAKADAKKRQQLALAWLREVDQVRVEDEHVTDDHGKLVVEYSQTEPVGMIQAPPAHTHHRVVFAADGTHGAIATL